jgi:predicted AAA+ superfamily ATPase
MILDRPKETERLRNALGRSRVVVLVGPRQCGKTTLARRFVQTVGGAHYFDLEDPEALAALDEPLTALRPLEGLVVVDEVQRRPDLFPVLRVLADRVPLPARFLLLGSASPALLQQSSESLAGRVEVIELSGFSLAEVGAAAVDRLWVRGGLPPAYTAESDQDSFAWRRQFAQTFLERDLPVFGVRIPAAALLRFWTMLGHYHGQLWNGAELARSLGVNESTARRYLDLLESFYMVRVLRPWHANLKKRQVKAPKVYFRDTGILHALLGIRSPAELFTHPRLGASWEGFAAEQAVRCFGADEVHFWGTHGGAEMDLVLTRGGRGYGIECKRADAPRITPSIRTAIADLGLERVWVVYPGERQYPLASNVEAVPAALLADPSFSFQ